MAGPSSIGPCGGPRRGPRSVPSWRAAAAVLWKVGCGFCVLFSRESRRSSRQRTRVGDPEAVRAGLAASEGARRLAVSTGPDGCRAAGARHTAAVADWRRVALARGGLRWSLRKVYGGRETRGGCQRSARGHCARCAGSSAFVGDLADAHRCKASSSRRDLHGGRATSASSMMLASRLPRGDYLRSRPGPSVDGSAELCIARAGNQQMAPVAPTTATATANLSTV